MPVSRLPGFVASVLLCASLLAGARADQEWSTARFRGHFYRLPLSPAQSQDRVYFSRFDTDTIEASLTADFWNALYPGPDRPAGWQLADRRMPFRVSQPGTLGAIDPWVEGRPAGQPPVNGALRDQGVRQGVHVWEDTASQAAFGLLLLTYPGRADFYVACDRKAIWSAEDSCDLVWNDVGLVATLPVYGNLLAQAPGFLDAFRRAVRPP